MPVRITTGSIFESDALALVNPVNCVGVAGAGLAKAFRHRYPEAHRDYVRECQANNLRPGLAVGTWERGKLIVSVPTKVHWRDWSVLSDIKSGCHALVQYLDTEHVNTVAIPALGCGLGGLLWEDVCDTIVQVFSHSSIEAQLFQPVGIRR